MRPLKFDAVAIAAQGSSFVCVSARLLVPLRMNFIHYLYAKGETVFSPRLGGRGLFIAPICFLSIISTTPFMPLGIEQVSFVLLSLCWLGILIGVSYILIPKKEAETKLKSWVRKYKKTTTSAKPTVASASAGSLASILPP